MKLTHNFLVIGAVIAVVALPQSWAAGKKGGESTAAVEEPAVLPNDEASLVDEVGTCVEPVDVVCDREVTVPVDRGGEVVLDKGGSVSPEVLRGENGEVNPDLIFQTTAMDGAPETGAIVKAGAVFGSDERAADIESKGPRITAVKAQKKGPVALIKKGRVFLR